MGSYVDTGFSYFFPMGHGRCNGDKTPWVMGPYNVVQQVQIPMSHGVVQRCMGPMGLSRTRKLITCITQVCQEIRDMKKTHSITMSRSLLSTCHKNKEHPSDIYGKDGTGCTRSRGNKKHAHYEDLSSSPNIQRRHETSSPPLPLPPSSPSPTSSHSSSEVSSSEPSTSFDGPPSCLTGDNVGETMSLSSSQKEAKESLEEQDSRGGGLPCPDKTSEWRSLNKAGIGDCLKSPRMGHWQHAEELEL